MTTAITEKFLNELGIGYEIIDGKVHVGGSLYLNSLTSIPEDLGNGLTVGGYLDLSSLTSIPEDFGNGLTVGGSLYLNSLTSIPEDLGNGLTVGGSLYLNSLTSIPEDFGNGLTVGGSLDLSSLTSIPEDFGNGLTVGGNLYLNSLTSIPEDFGNGLTVGGDLDLRSLEPVLRKKIKVNQPKENIYQKVQQQITPLLCWQNGKYRLIDNIFCEVLSQKRNIIKVKTRNELAYVFVKNNVYAHGNTVRQAYLDWLFKTSDRDVSKYENLDKSKEYNLDFWVIAYRTITGACSFGTNEYLENNKEKYKAKMTLQEVLTATYGQYGSNTFQEFFNRNN